MSDSPKTMRPASLVAREYLDGLESRVTGATKHFRPSGFDNLDRTFGGWLHEGHLIILAARPAMGKSALAQQLAENIAQGGATTVMFTLEMSSYEIAERSIARRSGVQIPRLKAAEDLNQDDFRQIANAASAFSALPFLIDDASFDAAALVHKTKAVAAALVAQGRPPLGLVVVDYLQLVGAKAANRTLEIGQITGALKRLAKELAVPVVALSQLNRNLEGRQNKRPGLADLRESGNIEQDADLVLFLYRDEVYDPASPDKGVAEVIAGKNRHGSTGTAKLAFIGERVMFGDLAHDAIPPAAAEPPKRPRIPTATNYNGGVW